MKEQIRIQTEIATGRMKDRWEQKKGKREREIKRKREYDKVKNEEEKKQEAREGIAYEDRHKEL